MAVILRVGNSVCDCNDPSTIFGRCFQKVNFCEILKQLISSLTSPVLVESKRWYCVIGCCFRVLDADWMDDVCQRCSDSRQILQADVAERESVRRESMVCGKTAIYSIEFRNV